MVLLVAIIGMCPSIVKKVEQEGRARKKKKKIGGQAI